MGRHLLVALVAFALLFAFPGRGSAADPCAPCGPATTVGDLQTATGTQGAASDQGSLPGGTLTVADLERAFQAVQQSGQGIMGFFGMLADGQRRVLPGDAVRQIFSKYGVSLDFLPVKDLREVVAEGGKVTFRFDFGGDGTREITLPDTTRKVLDSRNRADPYAADGKNRVKEEKSDGKQLRLSQELQLSVDAHGLTGVREGDIAVHHWLLGWVDIQVHSEQHAGKVATGDKDRPVLMTDGAGNPLVQDGHYVPQRYDDWVVIEAKGQRVEAGIPALGKK
jgi:hypothetical protein